MGSKSSKLIYKITIMLWWAIDSGDYSRCRAIQLNGDGFK